MNFRKAKIEELDIICRLYDEARLFMRQNGNHTQWQNGYPQKSLVKEDIEKGNLFVAETEGEIAAVFVFFEGEEPDYIQIDGKWLNNEPYGVIHRICVVKKGQGVATKCFDFAFKKCGNIKIDTFPDNKIMQHTLEKNGFIYCGTVLVENKHKCLAYQKDNKEYNLT